jgi:hypothetical protein
LIRVSGCRLWSVAPDIGCDEATAAFAFLMHVLDGGVEVHEHLSVVAGSGEHLGFCWAVRARTLGTWPPVRDATRWYGGTPSPYPITTNRTHRIGP